MRRNHVRSRRRLGKDAVRQRCERFFNALNLPNDGVFAECELTYGYSREGFEAPVRLPVAMFKNAPLATVANAAFNWHNAAKPSENGAFLEFSIRVRKDDRAVLTAQRFAVYGQASFEQDLI